MKTNIKEFLSIAKTWGCENCGSLYLKQNTAKFCPVCGDAGVQEVQNSTNFPDIELLINFHKNTLDYEEKFRNFISPVKFKTDQLNLKTFKDNAQWVFFPFWLVDSKTSGFWEAEFGFDYLVESSVEHLQNGEWISKKTNETRTDWKLRKGTIEKEYANTSISALSSFKQLTKIFGFYDLSKTHENQADYRFTDQITLIIPNIDQNSGWQYAEEAFIKRIKIDCQTAAAAQHTKTFSPNLHFSGQNWTSLLLPYLVSHYLDEEGKPHTIWINGQTLQINGDRYSSPSKGKKSGLINLGISFFSFLVFLLFGYLSGLSDLITILAMLSLLSTIGFLIGAIYSFFYPSNWNKNNINTFKKAG